MVTMAFLHRGEVITKAGSDETIVYADIGEFETITFIYYLMILMSFL